MDTHIRTARALTDLLDNKFSFLGFKFGLDPLIGFIPIIGDFAGVILSAYIIWIAHQLNIPQSELLKMWRNIIFDFIIGSIPILGDVSDFFYKSSTRNLIILERNLKNNVVEAEIVYDT